MGFLQLICTILCIVLGMSNNALTLECYKCLNEGCENNTNSIEDCNQLDELAHNCVTTSINNKVIERGCLTSNRLIACNKTYQCFTCNFNKCNYQHISTNFNQIVVDKIKCIICNSKIDQRCSQAPESLEPLYCKDGDSQCFTRNLNGVTIRGCRSMLGESIDNMTELCSNMNCNNRIFPATRLNCYQCHSDVDKECHKKQENKKFNFPCVFYVRNDSCFTKVNGKRITRGCNSDFPNHINCTGLSYCKLCDGNSCNAEEIVNVDGSSTRTIVGNLSIILIGLLTIKL